MTRIYLDHAATTPLRPEAVEAMHAAIALLAATPSNPSSVHGEGRAARAMLDDARDAVASALGVRPAEIAFTGGGSESDNLAIFGAAAALEGRGRHAITTAVEHHAIGYAFDVLRQRGWDVTVLPVDENGRVRPSDFGAALRPQTTLASVMLVNNELGTIEPVAELAALARSRGVIFHTDAVQAPGLVPLDEAIGAVDLLSLAAHKFGGPAGAGVLYVRSGTPLSPLIVGGAQERGRRAGTENLAGLAGLAAALVAAVRERPAAATRIGGLRDLLEREVLANVPGAHRNGAGAPRAPHIANVAFEQADPDALIAAFDLSGIAVSSGSACAAGAVEPSHVLAAIGAPSWAVRRSVRFSLGVRTTIDEVASVAGRAANIISSARDLIHGSWK